MKQYYVYILTTSSHSVLYVGVTSNLIKRISEHKNKLVKGFTEKYNVHKLVYYEILNDPENAIIREKSIKNLLRLKKFELIKTKNPHLEELVII